MWPYNRAHHSDAPPTAAVFLVHAKSGVHRRGFLNKMGSSCGTSPPPIEPPSAASGKNTPPHLPVVVAAQHRDIELLVRVKLADRIFLFIVLHTSVGAARVWSERVVVE